MSSWKDTEIFTELSIKKMPNFYKNCTVMAAVKLSDLKFYH